MGLDTSHYDPLAGSLPDQFQVIVAAPAFSLGVRCDEINIIGTEFLPPGESVSPTTILAQEAARQINAYLDSPGFVFQLPIYSGGSVFRRRVQNLTCSIPCGQTRTYGYLAHSLQSSPRAVGQACGANSLPLLVPCHRVVATNGPGGFAHARGGFYLDVKKWLLHHEGIDY